MVKHQVFQVAFFKNIGGGGGGLEFLLCSAARENMRRKHVQHNAMRKDPKEALSFVCQHRGKPRVQ